MIAPVTKYQTDRMVGIEIEIDSGDMELRLPSPLPGGWAQHSDGSLRNGVEMVLDPPKKLEDARPFVKDFDSKFNESRTNTCKRGGMHVHVQINEADYDHATMLNLARLYAHFQFVINSLVGESRHSNTYCQPFDRNIDQYGLVEMFSLNSPAHDRYSAKNSRSYKVVNFAMMRCTNADHRTVEFRQGSAAKRFDSIFGWTTLMVALVDIAKWHRVPVDGRGGMGDFTDLLRRHQARMQDAGLECENLAEWVEWRHLYLNQDPTDEQVSAAVACMGVSPHGMYHISRELDVSLPLAKRILERAHRDGKVEKAGDKTYRAKYNEWADSDFQKLIEAAEAREAEEPTPAEEPEQPEQQSTPPQAPSPATSIRRLRNLIERSQDSELDPGRWNSEQMRALVHNATLGEITAHISTGDAGGDYDTETISVAAGDDSIDLTGWNPDKAVTCKSDYEIQFVTLRTRNSDDRGGLQSQDPHVITLFCAIQAKLAAAGFQIEATHDNHF